MENNRKPILVLGIGNILLRDEGIGVHVINELQNMPLPDNIEVVDGGTAGADLLDILAERQKIIIIDAIQPTVPAYVPSFDPACDELSRVEAHDGRPSSGVLPGKIDDGRETRDERRGMTRPSSIVSRIPGTVLRFTLNDIENADKASMSMHDIGIPETLQMAKLIGVMPEEIVFFGVTPENLSCGLDLSETLKRQIPAIIKLILEEIKQSTNSVERIAPCVMRIA